MAFTISPETNIVTVMSGIGPIRDTWAGFLDVNDGDDDNTTILADLQRQGWHIGGGGAAPWFAVVIDDGQALARLVDAEGDQRAKVTSKNCDDDAVCGPIIDRADLIEEVANALRAR